MEYLQYFFGLYRAFNVRYVLNLIINGIPSIQYWPPVVDIQFLSFKPYYKWNTFNTKDEVRAEIERLEVLNLIINGIPSILD